MQSLPFDRRTDTGLCEPLQKQQRVADVSKCTLCQRRAPEPRVSGIASAGSLKKFVWEDSCPWQVHASNPFPNVMAFYQGLLLSHRIRTFEPRALLELRVLDNRLLDHREALYP